MINGINTNFRPLQRQQQQKTQNQQTIQAQQATDTFQLSNAKKADKKVGFGSQWIGFEYILTSEFINPKEIQDLKKFFERAPFNKREIFERQKRIYRIIGKPFVTEDKPSSVWVPCIKDNSITGGIVEQDNLRLSRRCPEGHLKYVDNALEQLREEVE